MNEYSKGSVNQNQIIEATASTIDEPTIQVFADGVELPITWGIKLRINPCG